MASVTCNGYEEKEILSARNRSSTKEKGKSRIRHKEESRELWNELSRSLVSSSMEDITLLCHTTSCEAKQKINTTGLLLGGATPSPSAAPLAKGSAVKGVWFLATKYMGKVLTRSLYGTERVRYPILSLMNNRNKNNWTIFFESTYYYREEVQYVRVVLANKSGNQPTKIKNALEWCKENLHEVDFCDNPVLSYPDGERFMKVIKNADKRASIYVEVLLLGDITINNENSKWDTVEHMNISPFYQPTIGISPKL